MQAGPAGPEGEGRGDAILFRRAHAADPETQAGQVLTGPAAGWTATTRGEEEEPWALLVSMAQWTTTGIGACARHVATLGRGPTSMSHKPRELHLGWGVPWSQVGDEPRETWVWAYAELTVQPECKVAEAAECFIPVTLCKVSFDECGSC